MSGDIVLVRQEAGVGRLILNRPERGNALNEDMVERLSTQFDALVENGARLVAFSGNGRHFCTGFDLSDLDDLKDADLAWRFVRIEMFLQKLHSSPVATMALAQGRTAGAGADLFASLDGRLAVKGATFSFPGARFGLILGTARLAERIGRDAARDTLLSNVPVDDRRAVNLGLATGLIEGSEIEAAIDAAGRAADTLDAMTVTQIHHATSRQAYDSDLANLVRSASRPGLRDRIMRYRDGIRQSVKTSA